MTLRLTQSFRLAKVFGVATVVDFHGKNSYDDENGRLYVPMCMRERVPALANSLKSILLS